MSEPDAQIKEEEEGDPKDSRMRVAGLFESSSSVNDILKEELFKSVVSNELNSLTSVNSLTDETSTEALKPPAPMPPTRSVSSAGTFLQSMLATLTSKAETAAPAAGLASSATPAAAASSASSKPSAAAIEGITSSRNWNNLGSQDVNDVNVEDIFKTQQDSSDLAFAGDKKKRGKTDWEALQKQGLMAAMKVASSPAVPTKIPTVQPSNAAAAIQTEPVASAFAVGDSNNKAGKKRARADNKTAAAPKPAPKKNARIPEVKNYYEPADVDVLLGRGGRANNHPGNKKYLELKDTIQTRYMAADKNEKTAISQELVDIVNKQWKGKFLKLDTNTNRWYEVDNVTARKKCSQSLREVNTPEVRAAKRARYTK
eukprot:scaffold3337_cov169-Amphora_coffeaeformis.AAC.42